MSTALQLLQSTKQQLLDWSWFKRSLLVIAVLTFLTSSFLFLTRPGTDIRIWMAQTVIITQHRDWAWMFVGAQQRDEMVKQMHQFIEDNAAEKQQSGLIKHQQSSTKKTRTIDELIKVEDISGTLWKGKRMYVFDPKSIRLMTPTKSGEGEKISSMVNRTGAVAGVNAGGFDDPEGLGNGFAAIGAIISGGDVIYTDQESQTPQHIVGFTKDGTLVIGKYNMIELKDMGISEAASFYPRVIANGKPLPISDGSRAPRTAVGQKADGTVIFIVIDGRQTHSVGATLKEVQDMFLDDGVINGGFLDGGASSEMVVNGQLVTKPSSRYGERRLPSAFLVYDHPEDAVANRVWDGVNKIDAGGSYDHPDFLKEQADLKARQRNNPTSAPAVTPNPAKTTETDKPKPPESSTGGTSTTKPASGSEAIKPAAGADSKGSDATKSTTTPAAGAKETTVPKATGNTGTEPVVPPSTGTTGTGTTGAGTGTNPAAPTHTPTTGAQPAVGATTQGGTTSSAPATTSSSSSASPTTNQTTTPSSGNAASTTTSPTTTTPTPTPVPSSASGTSTSTTTVTPPSSPTTPVVPTTPVKPQ